MLSYNNGLAVAGNKEKSDSSTTHAAVSDGTIIINDTAKQQQNVDDLSRDVAHANQTLSPIFDKEKEQQRMQTLQLIGEIGNQAADIARTQGDIAGFTAAKAEHPTYTDDQLRETAEFKQASQPFGTGGDIQRAITASTAAIQGLAGGDIAKALAGASAPYLAEVIHRQTTSADGEVNKTANLMAHAVVNAALSLAKGENALAGASSAVTAEAVGMISEAYYDKKPTELKEDEKQTISALASLAAGLAGGLVGGDTASAVSGMQTGKVTVENNALANVLAAAEANKKGAIENYLKAQKAVCEGNQAACTQMVKDVAGTGLDFVPIVGDIKGFVEAQTAIDYLAAAIGIIPGAGDVAGKAIKAAETALKKGDVAEASKLINKASDEIQAVKPLDVGSYKELKAREVVGDGLEHDHIPSFAAIRQAKEYELGRKLTPAEEKNLYNNATAIEVPKDVHQAGPTYGGKNTPSQVKQDAINLCGAECRDTEALRKNMLDRGYNSEMVDDAIRQLKERNTQIGVTK
ncbi:VENN motif pre-toxin domain-containing protein [Rosenbergiella epipactidis]|uniref:VENN motif pre-toxin domain-containing protein n=1 Tax=Rosenbergiella epipactidis TaxID=1544694 RepID=UPI003BA8793E